MIAPFSLQNAPSLMEVIFPVQRLSAEVFREKSTSSQILTSIGTYWKGRKPLILNKACVLGTLLPATGDDVGDLRLFERLMGMDPQALQARLRAALPRSRAPLAAEMAERYRRGELSYADLVRKAKRPEEMGEGFWEGVWDEVNARLGTEARSFPELVEQLGVARYGRRPRMADPFSGSGQIPFEAARLGCDARAADLNPVACLLSWGAFHVAGCSEADAARQEKARRELARALAREMDTLGVERDGRGWRGRAYLYCLEVRCPQSGWMVPVLPTLVISEGHRVVARLVPDPVRKRYDISIEYVDAARWPEEKKRAEAQGTLPRVGKGTLVHSPDGITAYRTRMSTIRGDYRDEQGNNRNRLRPWEKEDIVPRPEDILQERLYCVQWIRETEEAGRAESQFRAVTEADLERERRVTEYVRAHLADWEAAGLLPDMKIEAGQETNRLLRERGWTHWRHLFNPRQLLAGAILRRHMTAETAPFVMNALNFNSRLCMWSVSKSIGGGGAVTHVFYNQALNTQNNYGCRGSAYLENILVSRLSVSPLPDVAQAEVLNRPAEQWEEDYDFCVTDPPYGDAVNYEEIYEFFIAWMRRNPPEEFRDWVWDSRRALAVKGTGEGFRKGMVRAFRRLAEHMSSGGSITLMFTHKSGELWGGLTWIIWAAGLRVTASWYVVTEKDSALRTGANVTGTVLLTLRRAAGERRAWRDELEYELQEEVRAQVERMNGQNSRLAGEESGGLYQPVDFQMAAYTAAMRVLTGCDVMDGVEMRREAEAPGVRAAAMVDALIRYAQDVAEELLRPAGLPAALERGWNMLNAAERFYLKTAALEREGPQKLDMYTNMARALRVAGHERLMSAESRANNARLKLSDELGSGDRDPEDEWGGSPLRALLNAMRLLRQGEEAEQVLAALAEDCRGRYALLRETLAGMAEFLARARGGRADKGGFTPQKEAECARVLAEALRAHRA